MLRRWAWDGALKIYGGLLENQFCGMPVEVPRGIQQILGGGLEHFLFSHILVIIIPVD